MTNEEAKQKIIELADTEFLSKLVEIAKIYGWSGDYMEVCDFVEYIHDLKEVQLSVDDLRDPYDLE